MSEFPKLREFTLEERKHYRQMALELIVASTDYPSAFQAKLNEVKPEAYWPMLYFVTSAATQLGAAFRAQLEYRGVAPPAPDGKTALDDILRRFADIANRNDAALVGPVEDSLTDDAEDQG